MFSQSAANKTSVSIEAPQQQLQPGDRGESPISTGSSMDGLDVEISKLDESEESEKIQKSKTQELPVKHSGMRGLSKVTRSFYSDHTPKSASRYISDYSLSDSEDEDAEEDAACCGCCSCRSLCRERWCTGDLIAHWCYVLIFLLFLVVFPFYLKWLRNSPVPQEFWNKEFPKFPLVNDWRFVQERSIRDLDVELSEIPTTWTGCDHSCGGASSGNLRSAAMNFDVEMKLQAAGFEHTAYPVLLASNDWENWFLAADKRQAETRPYFAGQSSFTGVAHRHVTEQCTRQPNLTSASVERYNKGPTYLLICVTWSVDKASLHGKADKINGTDLGKYCDAIGGSCGWSCGSGISDPPELPGCLNSELVVDGKQGVVAGHAVKDAQFSGNIAVRPCHKSPGSEECVSSTLPLSRWPCHKCRNIVKTPEQLNNDTGMLPDEIVLEYDSLPALEIMLAHASLNQTIEKALSPQAFVLTSSLALNGLGPEGMQEGGSWEKVYDLDMFPRPRPSAEVELEKIDHIESDEEMTSPEPTFDSDRNTMYLTEANSIMLDPESCFGKRGPLYLVACVVNISTHEDLFEFQAGQAVAPPPFNDRCIAVSGRCAHACMAQQGPMDYCEDGVITQHYLDGSQDALETRTNAGYIPVHLFIWTLMFGFAVKMLSYGPGIFSPFKAAKYYKPEMTDQLKYIAVCTPSGGESKACVLRNLIGSVSARPGSCLCSYHVLYADEGHRHPHKMMFRVLVSILYKIPDSGFRKPDEAHARVAFKVKQGFKEDNVKMFFSRWVEDTNKFILADCNTGKMTAEMQSLPEGSAEAKKIEAKIDALSGLAALKFMREQNGWPKSEDSPEISELEEALMQMKKELMVGEKSFDGTGHGPEDNPKAKHFDDCEDYTWPPAAVRSSSEVPLFTLHYVARAKPDENERVIKVQHVARGTWCYKLPKAEEKRNAKRWLEWRKNAVEYSYGDKFQQANKYLVPVRTSRGKAGGLNFGENYLFEYCRGQETIHQRLHPIRFKYGLFGIADARHQFQPDFFQETVPYFFRRDDQLNPRVAFTQCPQYFQEMPDDADYLDTNNSQFFRLGCMLRNCCGGVSSCGTNGTWLVRDRRSGKKGIDSVWDMKGEQEMEQGFTQVLEWRFFHESCKVEDTASSLHRVVNGKYSQYINMRLSYGMAKDPTDYLAAVQRWAEGGVVLSLQTFFGREPGTLQIWAAFLIWILFVVSLALLVYGVGTKPALAAMFSIVTGDDLIMDKGMECVRQIVQLFVEEFGMQAEWATDYEEIVFELLLWLVGLVLAICLLWVVTKASYCVHHLTCGGRRKQWHRTRFPTTFAQWGRLMITVNNLTYFLWFWTAFFWVGFNYYSVFAEKQYDFDTNTMLALSWILNILNWSLVISSTFRYKIGESSVSNEVFSLTLTNIWRTTQMFYITAPLTLFSIIVGTSDFLRNRSFGEDISYWVGGDRGDISKQIVKHWTLLLVLGTFFTWFCAICGFLPSSTSSAAAIIVITFIGCDVLLPCAYLWLGSKPEKIPQFEEIEEQPKSICAQLQRSFKRCFHKVYCLAWHRNNLRALIFSKLTTTVLKWVAPIQQVVQPFLIMFLPELGINVAIGIIVAGRN